MKGQSVRYYYSRIKKSFKGVPKIALLSFVLFLTIATNIAPVFATDNYSFFKDLFSGTVDPQVTNNSNIYTKAGIYKEAVLPSVLTTDGVKEFKVGPWLVMDPKKNVIDGKVKDVFWDSIKNTGGDRGSGIANVRPDWRSFAVRLGYQKPDQTWVYSTTNIPDRFTLAFDSNKKVTKEIMNDKNELLQFLMYVDPANADVSAWWGAIGGAIGTIGCGVAAGVTTFGAAAAAGALCGVPGVAFGNSIGGLFSTVKSWVLVTHQQVRADVVFDNPVPYNTPMTADFWYCAGDNDNVPSGMNSDGTRAPKSLGNYVEYFTKGGDWADNEGGSYTYHKNGGGYKYKFTRPGISFNSNIPCYQEYIGPGAQPYLDYVEGKPTLDQEPTAAFKIGETINFTSPLNADEANQLSSQDLAGGVAATKDLKPDGGLPACDILNGWRIIGSAHGTFMGCIAQLVYYVVWRPVLWVAGILGQLFDFFLGYSLADSSYRAPFAVTGWKLVRDISNIFFIIILIWTGLATVFGFSGISMKNVVPALIINALLINFSLFGTQVIIDLSNVTARIFYNSTQVCSGKCFDKDNDGTPDNQLTTSSSGTGGYKSLSVAIVSGFNPQQLFKTGVLDSSKVLPAPKKADGTTETNDGKAVAADTPTESQIAGYFIVICFIATAIMIGVAKMFWGTAFMFLGRVIGLYTVMIFSPFAVMTRGKMPLVSKIEDLSWDSWLKDLTNYALLAPIFIFFLYIISAFIQSGFMDVATSDFGDTFLENVLHIAIPMLIVYFMINQGVTIAKKYSGKIGAAVQDWANKAAGKVVGFTTGAAIGVATGGTALVGRGAMSALGKTGLGTWAATNKDAGGAKGALANASNRFMQWGQKTSFDVRNTKVGGWATSGVSTGLGKLGIKMKDEVSGNIGLGQKDYIKGNVGIRAARLDKKVKRIEAKNDMSHLSDAQAKKVWENRTEKMANLAATKAWEAGKEQQLKDADPKLKALKDQETNLTKNLNSAIERGDTERVKEVKKQLETNSKEQKVITTSIIEAVGKEKKERGEDIKKDDLYVNGLKAERDRLKDDYGDINNAKDLSGAMRHEYALMMLEDSLTISGGKKRGWQPWAVGGAGGSVGGGITGILAGLGIGLGTGALGGGLLANYIDSLQQSDIEAANKVIKDYKKSIKKDTKRDRINNFQEELEKIDNLIDEHVKEVLKNTAIDIATLADKDKEPHITTAIGRAKAMSDLAKDEYDKALATYKAGGKTDAELEVLNKAVDKYNEKVDTHNRLKDALKNKRIYQDSIERENDRIIAEEERGKTAAERAAKAAEDKKNKP